MEKTGPDTSNTKKIVRIGGTAYSGSTLMDLMLSNGDETFSCGEVHALFRPFRLHHYNPRCTCLDPCCTLWKKVKANGETRIFHTLDSLLPQVKVFVDSSKRIDWFKDQEMFHNERKFEHLNVLIWKTPLEYAYSCFKRGKLKTWRSEYIFYHIHYFRAMESWISIRYSDLTREPALKLKKLCNSVDIPYFQGKELYWNKKHHTLFGSSTAKLHLYDKDTSAFREIVQDNTTHKSMVDINIERQTRKHRVISSERNVAEKIPSQIRKEAEHDYILTQIQRVLEITEVEGHQGNGDMQKLLKKLKPVVGTDILSRVRRHMKFRKRSL